MHTDPDIELICSLSEGALTCGLKSMLQLYRPFCTEFFLRNGLTSILDADELLKHLITDEADTQQSAQLYISNWAQIIFDADDYCGWYDHYTQSILLCIYDYANNYLRAELPSARMIRGFANVTADTLDQLSLDYGEQLGHFKPEEVVQKIAQGDQLFVEMLSNRVATCVYKRELSPLR